MKRRNRFGFMSSVPIVNVRKTSIIGRSRQYTNIATLNLNCFWREKVMTHDWNINIYRLKQGIIIK